MDEADPPARLRYDRKLLLLGPKRNEVLTLEEIRRYGADSFGDPDYLRVYGMSPDQWYARGIRLLGRTAVECTRDDLARAIATDIAALAGTLTDAPASVGPAAAEPMVAEPVATLAAAEPAGAMAPGSAAAEPVATWPATTRPATTGPATTGFAVVDPFAGSANTVYWILRAVPGSTGLAFELDPRIHALGRDNLALLDRPITLVAGDYRELLDDFPIPPDRAIVAFVAPPWGTALDEAVGLDLRRTTPPVAEVVTTLARRYDRHRTIYAIQVYETLEPGSLAEIRALFDWSQLSVYDLNPSGGNHGVLLGTRGWHPPGGPAS